MDYRTYPINSSEDAASAPGVNDFDLTRINTNFFTEGVVQSNGNQFACSQNSGGANMTVEVDTGLANIELTNTNVAHGRTTKTWFESREKVTLSISAADASNPRIDRIVAFIDVGDGTEGSADPNSVASDIGDIRVIEGTPASSPSAEATPANAISLALVDVGASATSITNGDITDDRSYVGLQTTVLVELARLADLASTSNGDGASLIGLEDAAGNITATNVEAAIAELYNAIPSTVDQEFYGDGSDGALNVTSGTTQIDCENQSLVIKQYTSFNVSVGATLEFINVPDEGVLFIPKVQGNVTIAGTIDLAGDGSAGGAGVSVSITSSTAASQDGNDGTQPYNNCRQQRFGGGGESYATLTGTNTANTSGGAGGGNAANTASNTTGSGSGPSTVAAAVGGQKLTDAMLRLISGIGITVGPGGGGGSGAASGLVETYGSGTFSATSGDGGRGGGGIFITCGGTFTFTGTINMSATAASSPSTNTGSGSDYALSASGSGGGAAGVGCAVAKEFGTISGTVTATAGAKTDGTDLENGGGNVVNSSNGTAGVAGEFAVLQGY